MKYPTTALLVALWVLAITPAIAAITDEVEVKLAGGEVVGRVRGQGIAEVVATVTNTGTRTLTGVRIEAYYSTMDMFPPANASWRPHEFIFEPALAPGESANLGFSDKNAAEYVMLSVTAAVFHTGLSYNGQVVDLAYSIHERNGVAYIATRDLMAIVGGEADYDALTYEIILSRRGTELRLRENHSSLTVNGYPQEMLHPVAAIEGRSYLPVEDIAPLLGIVCQRDDSLNFIMLEDL